MQGENKVRVYEKPEILASYSKEELEEIIQPAGDTPYTGGGGGCGCGGGSILIN